MVHLKYLKFSWPKIIEKATCEMSAKFEPLTKFSAFLAILIDNNCAINSLSVSVDKATPDLRTYNTCNLKSSFKVPIF